MDSDERLLRFASSNREPQRGGWYGFVFASVSAWASSKGSLLVSKLGVV